MIDILDISYKILILEGLTINIEELRQSQKNWIKNRNRCLDNNCISRLYDSRADALSKIIKKVQFSDVEKNIDTELSKCLKKTDNTAARLNCVGHSYDLWMKELENVQKSIVVILEYLNFTELVESYHKFVLDNENSHLAQKDVLSKILYNFTGTIYNEIISLHYNDMIARQYREFLILRGILFLLLEHHR